MLLDKFLFKETLYYSISKFVPGVFGLLSVVLFMRIIGAQEYGQYSYLLSQCNLVVAVGFGWLNQAQLRYYSKDSYYENYKMSQIIALLYSLIFCIAIITILFFFQNLSNNTWLVSIIMITTIGGFNYIKTFYQSKLLPKNIIFLSSVQSLMALLIPLIIMFFFGYSAISLMFGIALSFLLSILIFSKCEIHKLNNSELSFKRIKDKVSILKKWFVYGSPLSIWFAAGLALSFLDRYFINYYLPGIELGIYASLQEVLVRSFSLTLFPFTLAIHPRIMNLWNESKQKEAIQLILKGFYLMFGIGLVLLSIVWYYNDFIFLLIRSAIPQFNIQSKILILPLLSAGFLWQLSFLTHKMLELKEQTGLMTIAIIPSLIINIIGNNYFLPKLGGVATAYTSLFSALTYCIITGTLFIFSLRKIRIS